MVLGWWAVGFVGESVGEMGSDLCNYLAIQS